MTHMQSPNVILFSDRISSISRGIASFNFSWEAPAWNVFHINTGTGCWKYSTNRTNMLSIKCAYILIQMNLQSRMVKYIFTGRSMGGAPGAHPSYIWKKYDFFGVKSWFFTRNTPKIFAPPSARHNFFKCTPPPPPPTWNPGSVPDICRLLDHVYLIA
jgi:hypothetical protein